MNYLAHAYLSFNHPDILVGNMISDYVKGNKKLTYPLPVQQGIVLHRAIDTFTDAHPVTHTAKKIFKPAYRLYSAAFVDVLYDHFLANDTSCFTDTSLYNFSISVYDSLNNYSHLFPLPFQQAFPYMKKHNWLYNYRSHEGIDRSFAGVARRATYITETQTAFRLFEQHYTTLQQYYTAFFPDLKAFAYTTFQSLLNP